ncbi:aspartate/glutamate racemase family protein [Brevibacillus brevis]|uniref:Aspartate/glutamate racemase family protein n=1 Tax=Brevibacillus brevis TaxID=1393 RepID=A0ABY9T1W2_BREBE|nr:aspartate/glutamate racemase family protein [Brevibacillus brevis]WNC12942.1 aspartate/glutamate racemase family protein [Brevibacillus brevis]
MRIKVINPDFGMSDETLRSRERMLQAVAKPDTVISMDCLTDTHVAIDSALDVVLAGAEIVKRAKQAEQDGYDAVVLYCLSDPAMVACREVVRIPVIGGGQASMLVAGMLGYRFSLLTTSHKRMPEKEESVRYSGVDPSRLASVRSIELPTDDPRHDIPDTIRLLAEAGRDCIEKDRAHVLVLGCLSFAGMGREVSELTGAPVVDPAFAAINMAELLHAQRLSHSRIAYPSPPLRHRSWSSGEL